MKTFTSVLFTLAALVSLSSCSGYVYIRKTNDPEIIAGPKPYRIVFVNIFDYTSPAVVKEKNSEVFHAAVMRFGEGLASSFSKDESFNFSIADTLKKGIDASKLTTILSSDTIGAICRRQKADLLLTLDSINIYFDWELVDNGEGQMKGKDFYLYGGFYLSLYSSKGEIINRSKIFRKTLYTSRVALSQFVTFKPPISKGTEAIKPVSFDAGGDYVQKFYPTTVNETKMIYAGKAFKEANSYIQQRIWYKAIELLEQLEKSSDENTAIKARHNLSVVREAAEAEK